MTNICQQPLEKRLKTKYLRQSDYNNSQHMPADDLPKKQVDYLHTISRVGKAPLSPASVKECVIDFFKRNKGKKPTTIVTTSAASNRGLGVIVPELGYVFIRFKQGKRFKIY
jgi:hypothetical protein